MVLEEEEEEEELEEEEEDMEELELEELEEEEEEEEEGEAAEEEEAEAHKPFPTIMFRSPSPSDAAPKSGVLSVISCSAATAHSSTSSFAYVIFGSGCPPPARQ